MNRIARTGARVVQTGLRRFGYELRRMGAPAGAAWPDPWIWIKKSQNVRTLIDIGANVGDFSAFLGNFLELEAIHAFEPLASCQPALQEKARALPNLRIHPVALADRAGGETFFENAYGPSSSLLHVGEVHKREFPQSDRETATTVRVARLDDVLDADKLARSVLIKLDVQGAEARVIAGGRRVFGAAQLVLVEMGFVELYESQPMFDDIHELLRELGFRFAGTKDQVVVRKTGQPLFAHCLYIRREART